jgi:hypothetical protein
MSTRVYQIGLVLLLACCALVGEASASPRSSAAKAGCRPGQHVLLANAEAQVYAAYEGSLKELSIRGCAYGQRRSFLITGCGTRESPAKCFESAHVTLMARMAACERAFVVDENGPGQPAIHEWYVAVRDLRSGRRIRELPTGTPMGARPNEGKLVGIGPALAITLKSDGSVAWIAENEIGLPPKATEYQVGVSDKAGTRVVGSGTDIDPRSLALAGSTLYWTQAGRAVSTRLQ